MQFHLSLANSAEVNNFEGVEHGKVFHPFSFMKNQ